MSDPRHPPLQFAEHVGACHNGRATVYGLLDEWEQVRPRAGWPQLLW